MASFVLIFSLVSCAPKISHLKKVSPEEKPPSVTDIRISKIDEVSRVTIVGSEVLPYTLYSLDEPLALIIDLSDVSVVGVQKEKLVNIGPVHSIFTRSISEGRISRIEIRLNKRVQFQAQRDGDLIYLDLTPEKDQVIITGKKPPLQPEEPEKQKADVANAGVEVLGLKYLFRPEQSLIEVETRGDIPEYGLVKREDPLRLLAVLKNARLWREVPSFIKGEDSDKVVDNIKVEEKTQENRWQVFITVFLKQDVPYLSYQIDNAIKLAFDQPVLPAVTAKEKTRMELVEKKEIKPALEEKPEEQPVPKKKYTGNKISLDFQEADIKGVLRLLSEVSGFNIIIGEDVKGKVTTRMINVPWDLAMESIFKLQGLGYEKAENIIRVAPLERFALEEQEQLKKKEVLEKVEELQTKIFAINYANVKDLKANMGSLLSDRGKITIDERTSTMIVQDVQKNIDQLQSLLSTLDKQTPQVLIEARIVEINRAFEKELGIQWGGNWEAFTRYAFPYSIQLRGGVMPPGAAEGGGGEAGGPLAGGGIRDTRGVLVPQGDIGTHPLATPTGGANYLLNLPAAAGLGAGGVIGLALGHVRNASILDIQLSALENSNHGKILSSPRIATLDNREAYIKSGQRISYQTVSAEGTRTEFFDAALSLKVTPHVTPDNFILMKITANRDEPGARNPITGIPDINTREAYTEVLVKDGDTTVIGGIISRNTVKSVAGIPWLSNLPVLGWLFKNELSRDRNDELLIFITPRIIKTPQFQSRLE